MSFRLALAVFALQLLLSACDGGNAGGGRGPHTIEPPPQEPAPPHDPFIGVLHGSFEGVTESRGHWIWGDSVNYLCHQWSTTGTNFSAWFYGSNVPWSDADVYVLPSGNDPLAVVDAENFDYTTGSAYARLGDTVFFRGLNGFFGAWTIEEIPGDRASGFTMSGTWYFRADGGGDFTGDMMEGELPLRRGDFSCQ